MSEPVAKPQSKFARYRAKKRAEGKKLVRLWVTDLGAPGMREEIARQTALLRGSPEENEAIAWVESMTADLKLDPYDWGDGGPDKPQE